MKPDLPVKSCLKAAVLVLILTLIDLYTKHLAETALQTGPFVLIPGVFELRYLENRGAAFGILQNARFFFIILTLVFLAFMVLLYGKIPVSRKMLPLRLLIPVVSAGALGNFIDRLLLGYVRDFLYFSLIDFPIFNVADIYVTVSAFLFFLLILFYYKDEDFHFLEKKGRAEDEG
ncbi:MAG: signal peptidase II [Lachnospiraceae bacterium]|nr:signal peptidase II [Lachnospiraceae bacterium]